MALNMANGSFTVYVLQNPEARLYIGHTGNIQRRLNEHLTGMSRWTSKHGPWQLVYTEFYDSRVEAVARERALKSGRLNQELRRKIAPPGQDPAKALLTASNEPVDSSGAAADTGGAFPGSSTVERFLPGKD